MEAVLENLDNTLQVLAVSQTDFVKEWNGESVDRAFRWAGYCEELYTRFHATPSVRRALEDRLRATGEQLARTWAGYRVLTLSDMAQCQHRLLRNLLKNPLTPNCVITALLDRLGPSEADLNAEQTRGRDLDLTALVRCRAACKLLCDLNRCPLQKHHLKGDVSGLSLAAQVQGSMLLQRVQAMWGGHGADHDLKALLNSVLQDSGRLEDLSEVIAAALLSVQDTSAQELLFDWLQGHPDLLNTMCQSLPPDLCAKLSEQCQNFRLVHWGYLKKWASSLEYDVINGMWEQQREGAMTFKMLVEHFKAMWSCSALKEETEKELNALKQTDGNFEVQGLSVWTDLLDHLK